MLRRTCFFLPLNLCKRNVLLTEVHLLKCFSFLLILPSTYYNFSGKYFKNKYISQYQQMKCALSTVGWSLNK